MSHQDDTTRSRYSARAIRVVALLSAVVAVAAVAQRDYVFGFPLAAFAMLMLYIAGHQAAPEPWEEEE